MAEKETLELILSEIKDIKQRLDKFEDNQVKAELDQFKVRINNKVDGLIERVDTIEAIIKENLYDIAILKSGK